MATEIGTATDTTICLPPEALKTWHFNFSVIDNTDHLRESFALRYAVYCIERRFLNPEHYPAKSETDEFDDHSIHIAGINQDDLMIGTVRLVLSSAKGFPLLQNCELFPEFHNLLHTTPEQSVAEISRLAISRFYRRRKNDGFYGFDATSDVDNVGTTENSAPPETPQRRTKPEIVLGLYKAMYQASKRQGITHWFAAMERSLLRLLHRYNIDFTPIGPELDYFGPVVPYIAVISEIEKTVYTQCPEMFAEFMKGLEPDLVPEYASR